ncbi:MAG TPA: PEP-CTERM sorting domain-containing protein [Verrucomicrobiota bacterium]|nr:PEP-CTERM sorting domain-containing protein [Verrucomicrobiota bacterium]HNT13389.1 PEP-CTERM sorting domain-containing protein [Verrucomicrobiota bacterium]
MKKFKSRLAGVTGGLMACAVVTAPLSSPASVVEETVYYINSSLSTITLSGQAFGLNFAPLAPGGDVAHFSGAIKASLSGGVLTFSGGSSITALVNPAAPFTWPPNNTVNGVENYGMVGQGAVPGYGFAQIYGVYRDIVFDITGGTAQDGVAPAGMTFGFDSGALDYSIYINGSPYQVDLSTSPLNNGNDAANTSAALVSLTGTGLYGDTLILPVSLATTGSNRSELWNGVIVATVPEPSALALVGLGVAGLFGLRSRRKP